MKNWEDVIADFIADYDSGYSLEDDEMEVFVEQGLKPLLEDYLDLKKASSDLVESNLQIFNQILTRPNQKMKQSKLYAAISAVMSLTNDERNIQ